MVGFNKRYSKKCRQCLLVGLGKLTSVRYANDIISSAASRSQKKNRGGGQGHQTIDGRGAATGNPAGITGSPGEKREQVQTVGERGTALGESLAAHLLRCVLG